MSGERGGLRTMDYFILRTCERLGLSEASFAELTFDEQLRLLAYDQLRREDELAAHGL